MQNLKEARPAANRANDVFADRDGNVSRNVQDQWETRESGQWKPDNLSAESRERATAAAQDVSPETRERATSAAQNRVAEKPPASSASRQATNRADLNSAHSARQRGATRQMSRPQTMRAPARRR